MILTLKTPPTAAPVSVDVMKDHLRVMHGDEDGYIGDLIDAAVAYLDGYKGVLGRAIMRQTWVAMISGFPSRVNLRMAPFNSLDKVEYLDAANALQTLDSNAYYVINSEPAEVYFTGSLPGVTDRPDAVRLEFTVGSDSAPADVVHLIKLMVAHWYENREPVSVGGVVARFPYAVDALIAKLKVRHV